MELKFDKDHFAILMVLAEAVYCLRDPYVSISYAAGHFKQTRKYATMEALVNIVISVILVRQLGIVGVAIGTLTAMLLRAIMHILYLKTAILFRPKRYACKMMVISCFIIIGNYCLSCHIFNMEVVNYFEWVILAIKVSLTVLIIIVCISIIVYKDQIQRMVGMLKSKMHKSS